MKLKNYIGTKINKFEILDQKRVNNKTYLLSKCENCGKIKWISLNYISKTKCCEKNIKTQFKHIDYSGKTINGIYIIEPAYKTKTKHTVYQCKCFCGKIFYAIPNYIKTKKVKSCGCIKTKYTPENLQKAKLKINSARVEGTNLFALTQGISSRNTSGYKGVCWDKQRQKWIAQIRFQKKNYRLGRFSKIEDAIKARQKAEEKYFEPILEKYNKKLSKQKKS